MVGSQFLSKRCSLPRQPPLPILDFAEDNTTKYVCTQSLYKGTYTGFNVIIQAQDDMISLYTKGYFGKGSLSAGYPSYHKRLQKVHEAAKQLNPDSYDLVKASDSHDVPEEEFQDQGESINEELHLSLEEAFFLSYALDCLHIYEGDKLLDHNTAWSTFQQAQPTFIRRYVTYHHFRAKGWVVRSGVQYGADFVLYKDGPPFYHATYVVFIVSNDDTDVNFFLACHRAVEVTKKELLLCRVKIPQTSLDHVNECQVSEYTLKRWLPSENRNFVPKK